jgi:hypothetical protein
VQLASREIWGRQSGPHVLITGGVHGDEFEPMAAVRRLAARLLVSHPRTKVVPAEANAVQRKEIGRGRKSLEKAIRSPTTAPAAAPVSAPALFARRDSTPRKKRPSSGPPNTPMIRTVASTSVPSIPTTNARSVPMTPSRNWGIPSPTTPWCRKMTGYGLPPPRCNPSTPSVPVSLPRPVSQALSTTSSEPRRSSPDTSSAVSTAAAGSRLAPASTSPDNSIGLRTNVRYSAPSGSRGSRRVTVFSGGGSKKPWVARCR